MVCCPRKSGPAQSTSVAGMAWRNGINVWHCVALRHGGIADAHQRRITCKAWVSCLARVSVAAKK
eukprot:14920991-Alexandrium_andersonii.AAC.1